jgi:uncharacterized protein YkwD
MTSSPTALGRRGSKRAGLVAVALIALVAAVGCRDASFSSAVAVNETRSSVGRSTLTLDADLTAIAQRHAEGMASRTRLYHSSSATRPPSGFRSVGENVGRGHTSDGIHNALRSSSGHYRNMVSPSFRAFGVGSAYGSDGRLYVAQLFAG